MENTPSPDTGANTDTRPLQTHPHSTQDGQDRLSRARYDARAAAYVSRAQQLMEPWRSPATTTSSFSAPRDAVATAVTSAACLRCCSTTSRDPTSLDTTATSAVSHTGSRPHERQLTHQIWTWPASLPHTTRGRAAVATAPSPLPPLPPPCRKRRAVTRCALRPRANCDRNVSLVPLPAAATVYTKTSFLAPKAASAPCSALHPQSQICRQRAHVSPRRAPRQGDRFAGAARGRRVPGSSTSWARAAARAGPRARGRRHRHRPPRSSLFVSSGYSCGRRIRLVHWSK